MSRLRRIDRILLLLLGPLWLVVWGLAVISVERPVVILPFYVDLSGPLPEVAAIPAWTRPPRVREDVRPGDRLLAIDGHLPEDASLLRIASWSWAGMDESGAVSVEIERDGERFSGAAVLRGVAPRWPAVVVSLGLGVFAIGSLLRAPHLRIAQVGFPAFMITALWLGGQFGRTPNEELAAFFVRMAGVTLILPLGIRALRVFPEGVAHTGSWTQGWPWLLALQGLFTINTELGLGLDPVARDAVPKLLSGVFLVLVLVIGTQNYRASGPAGRRRFKWLILGIYLACLPPTTISVLSAFRPELGAWFIPSQLALLALPLALGVGVWKQNLFDIDRALNATMVFLTLGAVALGLLVVAVPGWAGSLSARTGVGEDSARLVLDAGVLLALVPVGLLLRGWLDRLVLRDQLGREREIAVLNAQLATGDKLEEIAALLAERLPVLWRCQGALVYAETAEGMAPVQASAGSTLPLDVPLPVAVLRSAAGPHDAGDGRLWLPLLAGARGELRILGAALLGARSDGDWSPADRAQLASVADRAAARLVSLEGSARLREARALTERLTRERDAADHATREKSAFLATASHDLRQPLHALGLFVGALEARASDPEIRTLLANVRASAGSMGQLFDALLDVTRLDSGALEPQVEEGVALGPFLEGLGRELAPLAEAGGIRLRVAPTRLAVASDPRLLRSIVQNLVGNALRYTERGGVLLGARRRGRDVRIEVWDTGPGIDAAEQEALFEAWRRGPEAAGSGGVGLGLSIVRRLAALLGHRLDVRSAPGRGSVFAIEVPRSRPAEGGVASSAPGVQALPAGRVLVVDDDPGAREGLRALLETWGLRVDVAAAAADALALVRESGAPDAVLCDLRLAEGRSGVDALADLETLLGRPLPALLLTAEAREKGRAAAREAGLPVLFKPVEPVRLRAALMHLLEAARREGEDSRESGPDE